jgi:hypothetical protein
MKYISNYKRFNEEFLNKLLGKDKKEAEKPVEQKPAEKPAEQKPAKPEGFQLFFSGENNIDYPYIELSDDNQIIKKELNREDIYGYDKSHFDDGFLPFKKVGLTIGEKGSDIWYKAPSQDENGEDVEGYYYISATGVQKLNSLIKSGKVEIVDVDKDSKTIKVK